MVSIKPHIHKKTFITSIESKLSKIIFTRTYKSRIDKIIVNADIEPIVIDNNKYFTESQLYDFMLEARTDKCKAFRKWVTDEVLPDIRKHGFYIMIGTFASILLLGWYSLLLGLLIGIVYWWSSSRDKIENTVV